jgi:hypothetical protein
MTRIIGGRTESRKVKIKRRTATFLTLLPPLFDSDTMKGHEGWIGCNCPFNYRTNWRVIFN